ncbi:hypothetical protein K439DRAFT_1612853 [Ramaria rubella]|nr:hypothetical protein K439DRAFT_1612853 [Ramaria rubella]
MTKKAAPVALLDTVSACISPHVCDVRTGQDILNKMQMVRHQNPNADTWHFIQACQRVQLSGVEEPFWSDLPYTDICKVICNDVSFMDFIRHSVTILHTGTSKRLETLRLIIISVDFPKHLATDIFLEVSLKYLSGHWSGREWKDLEHNFLPVIYGAQSADAIIATCAELDFIYHAQWWTLSEMDIQQMVDFNQKFHAHKDAFLNGGGRNQNHFEIPKLHAYHHYPENIRWLRVPFNYTTEISERYHIEVAKKAHKATNHKNYITQMITWLECQDNCIFIANMFSGWRETGKSVEIPPQISYLR